jgi:hypothetical protein
MRSTPTSSGSRWLLVDSIPNRREPVIPKILITGVPASVDAPLLLRLLKRAGWTAPSGRGHASRFRLVPEAHWRVPDDLMAEGAYLVISWGYLTADPPPRLTQTPYTRRLTDAGPRPTPVGGV